MQFIRKSWRTKVTKQSKNLCIANRWTSWKQWDCLLINLKCDLCPLLQSSIRDRDPSKFHPEWLEDTKSEKLVHEEARLQSKCNEWVCYNKASKIHPFEFTIGSLFTREQMWSLRPTIRAYESEQGCQCRCAVLSLYHDFVLKLSRGEIAGRSFSYISIWY